VTGFEALLAASCIVLAAVVGWLLLSAPDAAPAEGLEALSARVDSLFKLRLEWQETLAQIEDSLETVERKRRRAAASASKAAGGVPPELAGLLAAAGGGHSEAPAEIGSRSAGGALAALRARARAAGRL